MQAITKAHTHTHTHPSARARHTDARRRCRRLRARSRPAQSCWPIAALCRACLPLCPSRLISLPPSLGHRRPSRSFSAARSARTLEKGISVPYPDLLKLAQLILMPGPLLGSCGGASDRRTQVRDGAGRQDAGGQAPGGNARMVRSSSHHAVARRGQAGISLGQERASAVGRSAGVLSVRQASGTTRRRSGPPGQCARRTAPKFPGGAWELCKGKSYKYQVRLQPP